MEIYDGFDLTMQKNSGFFSAPFIFLKIFVKFGARILDN